MNKEFLLSNSSLSENERVRLYNGWTVKNEFYKKIFDLAEIFIPFMVRGHIYTLETIIPADTWRAMSVWEHIQAGWILSHIAVNGLLDIVSADSKSATKRYMHK